jgi:hypothetical protein
MIGEKAKANISFRDVALESEGPFRNPDSRVCTLPMGGDEEPVCPTETNEMQGSLKTVGFRARYWNIFAPRRMNPS